MDENRNVGGQSPSFEIRTLANLIKRFIDHTEGRNRVSRITGNNGWIIAYLVDRKGRDVFQRDLEEQFSVRRSTATKNLQLMEQKGLIVRESVPQDARLKRLVLTQKAYELYAMMEDDMAQMDAQIIKGFTQEDTALFFRLLGKARANLESNCSSQPDA